MSCSRSTSHHGLSDIAIAHCAGISMSELDYRLQDPRDRVDPHRASLHGLVVGDCIREAILARAARRFCASFETAKLLIEDELQRFGDLQRSR